MPSSSSSSTSSSFNLDSNMESSPNLDLEDLELDGKYSEIEKLHERLLRVVELVSTTRYSFIQRLIIQTIAVSDN